MDPEELILMAADTARLVLESGGETYRAEETAMSMIESQGGAEAECFATSTGVILSFSAADGHVRSVVRRVKRRSMNLEKVARVNSIVRDLAADRIDMNEAAAGLDAAERIPERKAAVSMAAAATGAGFFAMLFGGGWREAAVAAAAGAVLSRICRMLVRQKVADFLVNLVGGAFATLACVAAYRLGLIADADKAIIGTIMLLVPGVAITNAIRDMIAGDLVAGMARGADAFLAAAAISAGAGAAYGLWHGLGGVLPVAPADLAAAAGLASILRQALFSALATVGFALIFGLENLDILLAALGGALGWVCSVIAAGPAATAAGSGSGTPGLAAAFGVFLAAFAAGLWSEAAAWFRRRPATVYMVAGIIPLVPGGGMYYTMLAGMQGKTWKAIEIGIATIMTAFAIAAGLAAASTVARIPALARFRRDPSGSRDPRGPLTKGS